MVTKVVRRWRIEDLTADMRPPTDDDLPRALDGTVLDTPAKVLAHLERVNAERDRRQHRAG